MRALLPLSCLLALACTPSLPSGPVDIAWDQEACAECHMLVGEPAFAAQLQTQDGRVLNFDDPGCALRYEGREKPKVHAFYFHHHAEDRWLRVDQVSFVEVATTPMGYGLGAVAKGTPHAIDVTTARTRALSAQTGAPRGHANP